MEVTEEALAAMFAVLGPQLDERQRRLLAGAQARALGRGGVAVVARTSGMSHSRVPLGIRESDRALEPAGGTRGRGRLQILVDLAEAKVDSGVAHARGA